MTAAKADGNSDGEDKDKIMSYILYLCLGAMLPYPTLLFQCCQESTADCLWGRRTKNKTEYKENCNSVRKYNETKVCIYSVYEEGDVFRSCTSRALSLQPDLFLAATVAVLVRGHTECMYQFQKHLYVNETTENGGELY